HLAQELDERSRIPVQIYKDEVFPGLHADRDQPVVRSLEVAHTIELHHPLQRTVRPISPPVVGAPKLLRTSRGLGHYRGRMMPPHFEERPQYAVLPPQTHEGLASYVCREETPLAPARVGSPRHLPSFREDALIFQFRNARLEIPWRRNRGRPVQRVVRVVKAQQPFQTSLHTLAPGPRSWPTLMLVFLSRNRSSGKGCFVRKGAMRRN